jgi:hypothetical protein
MKWYRSLVGDWEQSAKAADRTGRGIVWDPAQCEQIYIGNYNYWDFFNSGLDDDVIIIEMDMAISYTDRRRFEAYCREKPDIVHVAPYEHRQFKNVYEQAGYVHRNCVNAFVRPGDEYCLYFGFGLVYLPLQMIGQFVKAISDGVIVKDDRDHDFDLGMKYETGEPANFASDCTFSYWHSTVIGDPVPVHWDVRPVHLHYQVPQAVPSRPGVLAA